MFKIKVFLYWDLCPFWQEIWSCSRICCPCSLNKVACSGCTSLCLDLFFGTYAFYNGTESYNLLQLMHFVHHL